MALWRMRYAACVMRGDVMRGEPDAR